jgi:hypothetical protein
MYHVAPRNKANTAAQQPIKDAGAAHKYKINRAKALL